MWLLGLGVILAALGALGVTFAETMIEIRRDEGMISDASGEITDEDRVLATRAIGAVFVVVGLFLVGYQLFG